jgi:hypothetical protein
VIEKVPHGTRMGAKFTHQSVANSGKSADGATEIHHSGTSQKAAKQRHQAVFTAFRFRWNQEAVPCPARATHGRSRAVCGRFHRNEHVSTRFKRQICR